MSLSTGNEKEVGLGIKASGVPREQIFLTTKLQNTDHRNVAAAFEKSLQDLDTPYLDLCKFPVCDTVSCAHTETCSYIRADALALPDDRRGQAGP